jgi:hypothetical protein
VSTGTSFVKSNGRQYQAGTGQIIGSLKPNPSNARPIDGFTKSSPRNFIKSTQFHKQAQKGQTLVRSGLKKPAQQFHTNLNKIRPTADPQREQRAKTTAKHKAINRFGMPHAPAMISTKQPPKNYLSGELLNAGHSSAKGTQATADPLPSMVTSVSHQKLERILDEALANADTHKQALKYHAARHFWQRRWFSGPKRWLAIATVVVVLGAALAFAWQRVPQLSVKMAGLKAHISASIPTYKPDGYQMAGPAKAVSGAVTMTYKSASNSHASYAINQAQSSLTSNLVSQNFVPKGAAVQTSQVEGNTVYIYGADNDAAWVNNGVLYTIKDKANLSSDELIKIVQGIQ